MDPDSIFVKDGNCYTSAGVTAGIDMTLALVEEDLGSGLALRIAKMMVVFLSRPGAQLWPSINQIAYEDRLASVRCADFIPFTILRDRIPKVRH